MYYLFSPLTYKGLSPYLSVFCDHRLSLCLPHTLTSSPYLEMHGFLHVNSAQTKGVGTNTVSGILPSTHMQPHFHTVPQLLTICRSVLLKNVTS